MTISEVAKLLGIHKSTVKCKIDRRLFKGVTKDRNGFYNIPKSSVIEYCKKNKIEFNEDSISKTTDQTMDGVLRGVDICRMLGISHGCGSSMVKSGDYPKYWRGAGNNIFVREKDWHQYLADKVASVKSKLESKCQLNLSFAESYALRIYIAQLKKAIVRRSK